MGKPIISRNVTAPQLLGRKVRLRPKSTQDAVNDYNWRRDAELSHLDAATPIIISFQEYLKVYQDELRYPCQACRMAIETLDGKYIGNCSYFNIDDSKKQAEIGIMIGDRAYWNQGYGTDTLLTLLNYIFSQTNLERIYLKTLDWNIRAQKCFEKCGLAPCGQLIYRDHSFIIMEIHRPTSPREPAKKGKTPEAEATKQSQLNPSSSRQHYANLKQKRETI